MRADVKWTNLSRKEIALRVTALGTPISRDVVSQLLRKHKYRKRKALKKKTMGPRNPNRNAQFENIARLKKEYLSAGLPVISMDTKKKELLGDFYREGKAYTDETIEVNDHDFGSAGSGVVIPHGLYDVGKNKGFVHLNTSHDTSELACESIAAWWVQEGRAGPTIPWPRNCCCCVMAAVATARLCICSKKTSKSWRTDSASRFA
jgi:Rhodopirellula transposase DDE domain